MEQFPEEHKLQQLTHYEICNLNGLLTIKEIQFVTKSISKGNLQTLTVSMENVTKPLNKN